MSIFLLYSLVTCICLPLENVCLDNTALFETGLCRFFEKMLLHCVCAALLLHLLIPVAKARLASVFPCCVSCLLTLLLPLLGTW